MTKRAYRLSNEAFFRETGWNPRDAKVQGRIDEVRRWFNKNMSADILDAPADARSEFAYRPRQGTWTNLMSWMQAMDFDQPVDSGFQVAKGDILIAYRGGPSSAGHQHGRWYTFPGHDRSRLALPDGQVHPHRFQAKVAITCLSTRVADAFLTWSEGPKRYSIGGGTQLFIPKSWEKLQPA